MKPARAAAIVGMLAVLFAGPVQGAAVRRVVLVTLDGARAGLDRAPEMPALRAIAARGAAFERATTPSLLTFPSTVALLTGRDPGHTGVIDEWSRGAPAEGPVLAGSMSRAGFRALGLPADPLLHSGTGIGRGFSRYDLRSPALAESARVDSALAWLRGSGRRFVWLELGFGEPVEVWRREDGPRWADAAAYGRRAAAIDAALARLDRGLAALGDPSLALAVVGTHGAAFAGEDALDPAARDFRIPLVIRAPGAKLVAGTEAVSLLDVAPTLLDLARVPRVGFEGRSLVAGARGKAAPAAPRAPATEDPEASRCRALLDDWIRHPPARHDSLALVRARALRERCPGSARAAIEEAAAFSIGGVENLAAQHFLEARARFPGDHRIAIGYADHLLRHKRFTLVATTLSGIPIESPLAAPAAWREALAATAQLDFPGARKAIERASALSVPAEWVDAESAVARLERAKTAADQEPANVDARLEFGRALGDFGVLDEAYVQFHQARLLDTTRVEADLALAEYLERDHRFSQAARALERGLKKDPNHRGIRLALAEALAALGDSKAAIPHYVRVLEQDPSDARSHYNLACLYARTGDSGAALASLERAIAAGYRDWDQIEADPDLEPVRKLPEFTRLAGHRPPPR